MIMGQFATGLIGEFIVDGGGLDTRMCGITPIREPQG